MILIRDVAFLILIVKTTTGSILLGDRLRGNILFTPGPVTTSRSVKEVMMVDMSLADPSMLNLIADVRSTLVRIAGLSANDFTSVLMQGSGTYTNEASIHIATPKEGGKVLVINNGYFGYVLEQICVKSSLTHDVLTYEDGQPVNLSQVEQSLQSNKNYTTVVMVHHETSSGIINPIKEVGSLVRKYVPDASFLVDAISSFGGIPIDIEEAKIDYLVGAPNKCLQGLPGFAFVLARKKKLLAAKGNQRTYALDLVDQYNEFEMTNDFRFTYPTHLMLAFQQALKEFQAEGFQRRSQRYQLLHEYVREGMRYFGFQEFLKPGLSGYVVTSYRYPSHPNFNYTIFQGKLADLGQILYPSSLTRTPSFRVGNIGNINSGHIRVLLSSVLRVLKSMNIPIPIPK